ncbi:putative hydrolase protein [Xylariales sp. PMI_506]|nr:putative hydrolase protein [Xylariales sp. PMI_506]
MASANINEPAGQPPAATALLLLDYFNIIVGSIPDAAAKEKLISSTQALLAAARASDAHVIHCLIDKNSHPAPTSKMIGRWVNEFKPAFDSRPEFAEQVSAVAAVDGEPTYVRQPGHVTALDSPGLLDHLRGLGVKSLVLCGVVSSGCVLSTARNATDLDFVVTVAADACWDRTQEVHDVVMNSIVPMTGHVASIEEAVGYLKGSTSA